MSDTKIYDMSLLNVYDTHKKDVSYIFSLCDEKRSQSVLSYLIEQETNLCNVAIIKYYSFPLPDVLESMKNQGKIIEINIDDVPINFIGNLKQIPETFWGHEILIDISCIRVPEMFTLLKYIKIHNKISELSIAYSIPYDYVFEKEPFTSYRSFYGDLNMYELLGFSGKDESDKAIDLYLFMGFESALGLKVIENCTYNNLNLINNLPSFFPKYKDISVINNYQLMQNTHRYLYTPADNPFETYNLLNKDIKKDASICIAPLGTKPVALGVCLYALDHDNVRVVFPISNEYNRANTLETYKTYLYKISLNA